MGIVMAAMVSALGAYVVWETREDVLLSRLGEGALSLYYVTGCQWWLLNLTHCCSRSSVLIPGARFHLGYFIVDIYAMFQETKWSFANSNASLSARVTRLLQKKYLFIFHHAVFVLSGLTLLVSLCVTCTYCQQWLDPSPSCRRMSLEEARETGSLESCVCLNWALLSSPSTTFSNRY